MTKPGTNPPGPTGEPAVGSETDPDVHRGGGSRHTAMRAGKGPNKKNFIVLPFPQDWGKIQKGVQYAQT